MAFFEHSSRMRSAFLRISLCRGESRFAPTRRIIHSVLAGMTGMPSELIACPSVCLVVSPKNLRQRRANRREPRWITFQAQPVASQVAAGDAERWHCAFDSRDFRRDRALRQSPSLSTLRSNKGLGSVAHCDSIPW